MTVEAFYIIRVFQPLLKRKMVDARLSEGRWTIRYGLDSIYLDLSNEVKRG